MHRIKIILSSYFMHVKLLKKEVIPEPVLAGEGGMAGWGFWEGEGGLGEAGGALAPGPIGWGCVHCMPGSWGC